MPVWPTGPGETSPPSDPHPVRLPAGQAADDDLLAAMFVRMWSLASGRRLRPGVSPEQLSADELADFWADDFSQVCGRHSAQHAGPAGAAR